MKRLGTIGTILFFVGWVPALFLRYALPEPSAAFFIPATIAVLGLLMFMAAGMVRLLKGAVQIRPYDAIKRASLLMLLLVPATFLLRLVLPSSFSAMESVVLAVLTAILLGLYSTAYRMPE